MRSLAAAASNLKSIGPSKHNFHSTPPSFSHLEAQQVRKPEAGGSLFLPSLSKSFASFNQALSLSIGNFVAQTNHTTHRPPTFDDPSSFGQ